MRFYQIYPQKVRSLTALSSIDPQMLLQRLSNTHIEDETKRAFYEIECIRGNWSVRELKRQGITWLVLFIKGIAATTVVTPNLIFRNYGFRRAVEGWIEGITAEVCER